MKVLPGRLIFDLVLLAILGWGIAQAYALPSTPTPGQLGAGSFPITIMLIAVPFMLVVLVQDVLALTHGVDSSDGGLTAVQLLGIAVVTILLTGYVALFERLGFLISTVTFLFLAMLACTHFLVPAPEERAWGRLILGSLAYAVAATAASFFVFSLGFGLTFP